MKGLCFQQHQTARQEALQKTLLHKGVHFRTEVLTAFSLGTWVLAVPSEDTNYSLVQRLDRCRAEQLRRFRIPLQ